MGEVQSPRNVHRTTPDPSSLTTVKGYADKLTLYLCKASAYWQVRYFCNGREFRKSTRFTNTKDAIEFAKRFYDDINLRQHTGQRNRKRELFEHQAMEFMTLQESRCLRGDITRSTFQNALDRLNQHVLPFFEGTAAGAISYPRLEQFLAHLAQDPLKPDTVKA